MRETIWPEGDTGKFVTDNDWMMGSPWIGIHSSTARTVSRIFLTWFAKNGHCIFIALARWDVWLAVTYRELTLSHSSPSVKAGNIMLKLAAVRYSRHLCWDLGTQGPNIVPAISQELGALNFGVLYVPAIWEKMTIWLERGCTSFEVQSNPIRSSARSRQSRRSQLQIWSTLMAQRSSVC